MVGSRSCVTVWRYPKSPTTRNPWGIAMPVTRKRDPTMTPYWSRGSVTLSKCPNSRVAPRGNGLEPTVLTVGIHSAHFSRPREKCGLRVASDNIPWLGRRAQSRGRRDFDNSWSTRPFTALRGYYAKDFPEHARRRLGGVNRMDQRLAVVVQERLCLGLISIQALPDDDLVGIIEPVVLERAFPKALDQYGAVGTGEMEDFDHVDQ